jgi:putative transposase
MRCVRPLVAVTLAVLWELAQFVTTTLQSQTSLVAENLVLRKQLAFYQEHKLRPQPLTDAGRFTLVLWSRLFDWKSALVIVKPDTLIGWHRRGFKLFWRLKSGPGRPSLRREIRELVVCMARENPTWGQMRVAAELPTWRPRYNICIADHPGEKPVLLSASRALQSSLSLFQVTKRNTS